MMSDDKQDASTESRDSPPAVPPESPGSSVSTRLQEEYAQLLKYAAGMPGPDTRTLESTGTAFQPITRSGGSSSRHTPVDQQQEERSPWKVIGHDAEADTNSNSIYPNHLPRFDSPTVATSQGPTQANQNTHHRMTTTMDSQTFEEYSTVYSTLISPSVEEMGGKLDTWLGKLRSDILAEFGKYTIRALEQQSQMHQRETQDIINEKHRLEREVNRLSELVNTCEQSMTRKDTCIENLTQALAKQKDKVMMAQAFYHCKAGFTDAQREKFTDKLAQQHHERRLSEKVLKAWFGVIQSKWKQRVERLSQEHAQNVCRKLSLDYEEKIKSMAAEIESLEKKVKCMQKEREQYAEQVKKAFMRGVCALNQEAMSAFVEEDRLPSNSQFSAPSMSLDATNNANTNINNNLEASVPHKGDQPPKSLPADITITAIPDLYSEGQHHSMPTLSPGQPQKSKSKQPKSKSRPATASGATSKSLSVLGHSGSLAPPMASIVVERHNPVTKQTVGKATASRYPKQSSGDGSGSHGKHGVIRSQPAFQTTQTFRPLAGQTLGHTPTHPPSPGIKVVE